MAQTIVAYTKPGHIKKYFLYKEERTQLQGLGNDNKTSGDVVLESLWYNGRECFAVHLSNYKQTNHHGMFGWVEDLAPLRQTIIFTLNEQGLLGEIQNHPEIYKKWKNSSNGVIQKHYKEKNNIYIGKSLDVLMQDPIQLADTLRYTSPYINLFMGINGKEYSEQKTNNGYRELQNFVGVKSLPVNTEEILIKSSARADAPVEIEVAGTLAQEKIDEDKIASLVRLLRNHPRVPTDIKLRYNENIKFDSNYWPIQSVFMNLVVIPGFLFRQETTVLKEI